jgi:hypothetical protein
MDGNNWLKRKKEALNKENRHFNFFEIWLSHFML